MLVSVEVREGHVKHTSDCCVSSLPAELQVLLNNKIGSHVPNAIGNTSVSFACCLSWQCLGMLCPHDATGRQTAAASPGMPLQTAHTARALHQGRPCRQPFHCMHQAHPGMLPDSEISERHRHPAGWASVHNDQHCAMIAKMAACCRLAYENKIACIIMGMYSVLWTAASHCSCSCRCRGCTLGFHCCTAQLYHLSKLLTCGLLCSDARAKLSIVSTAAGCMPGTSCCGCRWLILPTESADNGSEYVGPFLIADAVHCRRDLFASPGSDGQCAKRCCCCCNPYCVPGCLIIISCVPFNADVTVEKVRLQLLQGRLLTVASLIG